MNPDPKPVEKPAPTLESLGKGTKPTEPAPKPAAVASPPQPQAEMPRYKCHKEVHALKIKKVRTAEGAIGFLEMVPEDARFAPIQVASMWAEQHQVAAGGYYVVYKDGYTSFSPGAAFEDGYTLIP